MHYLGSKKKLISFIAESITRVLGEDLSQYTFCDLFAGSGAVSLAFKDNVKSMIVNDSEFYSYVLLRNILRDKSVDTLTQVVKNMLTCKEDEGLIYEHYSLEGKGERNYFSSENARLIDTFRKEIEGHRGDEALYYCLLASLIEASHAVSNTISIYSAFLKELKPLAQGKLNFQPLLYPLHEKPFALFCEDANRLIENISGDILYLDPPYNHRQYGANYHILNTIARYDDITPQGKTGLRAYTSSAYCKASSAYDALEEIIRKAKFSTIFLSYNDEGLLSSQALKQMMQGYGVYTHFTHKHPRFKAHGHKGKNPYTLETLHVLKKEH